MTLTAEQLNQNLTNLAKFSPEDLQDMTVKALRKKLSECGLTGVTRGDTVVPIASCKKAELIDAIRKATFKEKVVHQMVPELTVVDLERLETLGAELDAEQERDYAAIAKSFYEQLRVYVEKRWDVENQVWKPQDGTLGVLASMLIGKLRSLYRDRTLVDKDGNQTVESGHHTRLNARGAILKRIEQYIVTTDANQHYFSEFMRTFGTRELEKAGYITFRSLCFKGMSDDAVAKTREGDVKDKVRKTNRSVINLTPMLQHAYQVLHELTDETPKTQWKEVGLALVLVTGRRPYSEVFCSAEFEVIGDYELRFTGQAKTKGRSSEHYQENPSYNIPTLIPAKLALRGLEWLGTNGKRVDVETYGEDIQRARAVSEKRYSKDLGGHMKLWVDEYLDITVPSETPKKVTPHTLREMYALAAYRVYGGTTNYEIDYVAKILGHDKDDSLTAQKYQQDFLLSEDSLCKI